MFAHYTHLNVNRGHVLEEALSVDLIPSLQKLPTPRNADTSKHCYNIDECWALKDKLEELIQAGYLQRFIYSGISRSPRRNQRGRSLGKSPKRAPWGVWEGTPETNGRGRELNHSRSPRWQSRKGTLVRGVINTIVSWFAGGGSSASSRKKHLRNVQAVHHTYSSKLRRLSPITFTDRNFKVIDPKQDDPMVITVTIDDFAVTKTLVDQGSSVSILY